MNDKRQAGAAIIECLTWLAEEAEAIEETALASLIQATTEFARQAMPEATSLVRSPWHSRAFEVRN